MASDLEDLIVLRKQYPEIITMCKAVDVETDTELEITMGDKKERADKDIDEATHEKTKNCEKDRMH